MPKNSYEKEMSKYFVTSDIAINLKEIGFDEWCMGRYVKSTVGYTFIAADINEKEDRLLKYNYIQAPNILQVMDWFSKKHGMLCGVSLNLDELTMEIIWFYKIMIFNDDGSHEIYMDYHDEKYTIYMNAIRKMISIFRLKKYE